jgi:Rho GDP-dissociation inhibitor
MIGSFGPSPTLYTNNFHSEEAPSGMLARSGTYTVQTKITDDDKEVYAGQSEHTTCPLSQS